MLMDTNLQNKIESFAIIFAPVIFYFTAGLLNKLNVGSLCIWKFLTGHECIGCGTTRALCAIMHGNFLQAYEYNHLIVITAPLLLFLWLKYSVKIFQDKINRKENIL